MTDLSVHDLRAALLMSWRIMGDDWKPQPALLPPIPASWQRIMDVVSCFKSEPVGYIAGGACRDLILGRREKDVDIFVTPEWCGAEVLSRFGRIEIVKYPAAPALDSDALSYDDSIDEIVELHTPCGRVFQVIQRGFLPDVGNLIDSFDFGICRVAWHPSEGWTLHPDFMQDLLDRVFRIRRDHGKERTLLRADRFAARFPDFKMDVSHFDAPVTGFAWLDSDQPF